MSEILRSPNGNAIMLTPRSGSHSLALAAMQTFWPEIEIQQGGHPAWYFVVQQNWPEDGHNCGIVVRNPVERFRSMCAHRPERTLEEHLAEPFYGPLPKGNFARYFRFEDQLNEAAEWLGLPTPLPQEDASDPALKPTLTAEQEARVRELFADDIALWQSLQP
ncbi:MAG: hypothetical protein EB117_13570 [Betaproteobacteria bacterium]|nr:hypothetical protein [Betaproteobacteria bacterium]